MNKIEALELELAARKMVEGTELDWWEVLCLSHSNKIGKLFGYPEPTLRLYDLSQTELALGIIEGKPVWNGDRLYFTNKDGSYYQQIATTMHDFTLIGWSRNPPNPNTITVEKELAEIKHKYHEEHQELLKIHHIGMCVAECPPIKSEDSSTVRMVKEMAYRLNRVVIR